MSEVNHAATTVTEPEPGQILLEEDAEEAIPPETPEQALALNEEGIRHWLVEVIKENLALERKIQDSKMARIAAAEMCRRGTVRIESAPLQQGPAKKAGPVAVSAPAVPKRPPTVTKTPDVPHKRASRKRSERDYPAPHEQPGSSRSRDRYHHSNYHHDRHYDGNRHRHDDGNNDGHQGGSPHRHSRAEPDRQRWIPRGESPTRAPRTEGVDSQIPGLAPAAQAAAPRPSPPPRHDDRAAAQPLPNGDAAAPKPRSPPRAPEDLDLEQKREERTSGVDSDSYIPL